MAISTDGKIGAGLTLLFGLGTGAIAIWPEAKSIGWATVSVSIAGLLWLAFYHFRSRAKRTRWPQMQEYRPSTTISASGRSKVDIADSFSTADILAHGDENASITARRVTHRPPGPSGRSSHN